MLGGVARETGETYEIASPFDGAPVAVVHRATADDVEEAITRAVAAFQLTRRLASWQRDTDHIEKAFDFGGMAARNGVTAALLVQAGGTGVEREFLGC